MHVWGAPEDLLGGTRAPVVAEFWDIVAKADILLVPLQRCNFLSAKIITKNERRLTPYFWGLFARQKGLLGALGAFGALGAQKGLA